jgi:glycosyltransferase involved in cell wall biosynthesis
MGIPLVATDVPGCRQVVEDGVNGYLCRPYDAKDLAQKMMMMIRLSDAERNRLGAAGRAKMLRDFDERIVLDCYLNAVREFAKQERH